MSYETNLGLSLGKFSPQSARGVVHTLVPQSANAPVRTLTGQLVNSVHDAPQKFRSILEGEDIHVPPFDEVLIGQELAITASIHLSRFVERLAPGDKFELSRAPVIDSILMRTFAGDSVESFTLDEREITYTGEMDIDDVTISYRPIFQTRVVDFHICASEKTNKTQWKLVCDEI